MSIRNFRKALGLLIVDIVIIIGIFVLQFRTDSSIIEKLGHLQITMEKNEAENATTQLNNKLNLTYNGLNFWFDEQTPVKAEFKNGNTTESRSISLQSYEKKNDYTFDFKFSDGVILSTAVSTLDSDAALMLHVNIPSNINNIYIPYNYSYNMKIKKEEPNRIIFDGKKASWELQGLSFADGYVSFNHSTASLSYSSYTDDAQQFTFASIVDLPIADKSLFVANVEAIKSNLISSYPTVSESNLSEQIVVSYVAAMAERGNYSKAVDEVPQTYKHAKERTYLSAPYLNNLSQMYSTLEQTLLTNQSLISSSAESGSLNIFGIRNLANFLCIHPKRSEVITILNNAVNADIENCSLSQVIGILQVYIDLTDKNPEMAQILQPVTETCVDKIAKMCTLNGNILTISENDTFLSVIQSVEIGIAVLRYGLLTEDTILQQAGYAIVNSYISESSSFDIRTLANIYPIFAYNNHYYPHFQRVKVKNTKDYLWAWTCAKNIEAKINNGEELTLNVDFPEGYTHYLILNGVPKFHTIYIYNMAFRTDPRFETYNSSGYVYKKETKTLLLKSRHKSKVEEIRLEIGAEPGPAPAPKKVVTAEPPKAPVEPVAVPEPPVEPAAETTVETPKTE